jgi:hypothetical protein
MKKRASASEHRGPLTFIGRLFARWNGEQANKRARTTEQRQHKRFGPLKFFRANCYVRPGVPEGAAFREKPGLHRIHRHNQHVAAEDLALRSGYYIREFGELVRLGSKSWHTTTGHGTTQAA